MNQTKKRFSRINKFKRFIFNIIIVLSIIQQMPIIKDAFYNEIRIFLYLILGLYSIYSLISIRFLNKNSFFKLFFFTAIYSVVLFMISRISGFYKYNLFELLVPLGIFICSLNTNYTKEELAKLLFLYSIMAMILGLSSIFYYGEGFNITERYFLKGKNQIGPLLGIASIIMFVWIVNKEQFGNKNYNIFIKVTILTLLLLSIIIIRNRSSLLAISLTFIAILFKEFKFKRTIKNILFIQVIIIILIILVLLGGLEKPGQLIYESVFSNYDISNLNSVSAGRTDVYRLSFKYIKEYPILGELGNNVNFPFTPHNYILNKFVRFGVVASFPIVLFYVYLHIFMLKSIYKSKSKFQFTLPMWVLMFSLIVSVLEYSYPYGPGVSQLMLWFLIGQYINENQMKLYETNFQYK